MTQNTIKKKIGCFGDKRAGKTSYFQRVLKALESKGFKLHKDAKKLIKKPEVIPTPDDQQKYKAKGVFEKTAYTFTFLDCTGETCEWVYNDGYGGSDEDNKKRSSKEGKKALLKKVIEDCDLYIYFADPFGDEAWKQGKDKTQTSRIKHIQKHLDKQEKEIRFILREIKNIRGHKYLPIVFVLTHRDLQENKNTTDVCAAASDETGDYSTDVIECIKTDIRNFKTAIEKLYSKQFTGFVNAPCQAKIFYISNTDPEAKDKEYIEPLEALIELEKEFEKIDKQVSDTSKKILFLVLLVMAAICVALLLGYFGYCYFTSDKTEGDRPGTVVAKHQETAAPESNPKHELETNGANVPDATAKNQQPTEDQTANKSPNVIDEYRKLVAEYEADIIEAIRYGDNSESNTDGQMDSLNKLKEYVTSNRETLGNREILENLSTTDKGEFRTEVINALTDKIKEVDIDSRTKELGNAIKALKKLLPEEELVKGLPIKVKALMVPYLKLRADCGSTLKLLENNIKDHYETQVSVARTKPDKDSWDGVCVIFIAEKKKPISYIPILSNEESTIRTIPVQKNLRPIDLEIAIEKAKTKRLFGLFPNTGSKYYSTQNRNDLDDIRLFNLDSKNDVSLETLGLPLLLQRDKVIEDYEKEHGIKITIHKNSNVPQLLWDIAKQVEN